MHKEQDLKNTPEYRSGMFRIVTCPVCGYPTLDMYWICELSLIHISEPTRHCSSSRMPSSA